MTIKEATENLTEALALAGVSCILAHIGEDPHREGLRDTPKRVVKAFREMTAGYKIDPAEVLSKTFDETSDRMVVLRDIAFTSLCEHHLLPFTGKAAIAYLPRERVVGLSKLARLVDCFAQRLQVQERMTNQIADALVDHLNVIGAAVQIEATHSCMACRGIRKAGAVMQTSAMRGRFRGDAELRNEFRQAA